MKRRDQTRFRRKFSKMSGCRFRFKDEQFFVERSAKCHAILCIHVPSHFPDLIVNRRTNTFSFFHRNISLVSTHFPHIWISLSHISSPTKLTLLPKNTFEQHFYHQPTLIQTLFLLFACKTFYTAIFIVQKAMYYAFIPGCLVCSNLCVDKIWLLCL
jgi:hypothetical protein